METFKKLFFLFSFLLFSSFLFAQAIGANQIKVDNTTIKGNATNQIQVDTSINKIASQHFVLTHGGGSGTVTSIATGFGLSGGPITTSGTLLIDTSINKIATQFYARSHAGAGTVTSVAMSTPTGLSILGSPITSSGTLALSLTSGYVIPTTTQETNWNTAYTNRITSLTTTGSGAATLISNVLNIPTPTIPSVGTWGALNYPSWSSGTPFVKMTAAGTFALDASTYLTSIGTGTTNELTYWSGTNAIGSLSTATYPSLTELSYVKGVTSAIQTQLGNKASASAESSQSRLLSAATGLTTNVVANVTATPLTLAAGTWDISAMIGFNTGIITNITNQGVGGISITSATLPSTDATAVPNANGEIRSKLPSTNTGIVFASGTTYVMSIPQYRVVLSGSTTFYLVAQATFTVSTLSIFGSIRAIPVK